MLRCRESTIHGRGYHLLPSLQLPQESAGEGFWPLLWAIHPCEHLQVGRELLEVASLPLERIRRGIAGVYSHVALKGESSDAGVDGWG